MESFLFIATRVDAAFQRRIFHGSNRPSLLKRSDPDNTVQITTTTDYCMIFPRQPHTNIGDSEDGGWGTQAFCTNPTDDSQGRLSDNFWSSVTLDQPEGSGNIIQLTGCINTNTMDRLNPDDSGGQYDSSGGDGGNGNPPDSMCIGYNHYVELIEPSNNRACIRCCDDPDDCPTNTDLDGCPTVIPGDYFDCGDSRVDSL